MYICVCNAITDKDIRRAAEAGATDLWALQTELGVATGCGSCKEMASEILHDVRRQRQVAQPQIFTPAMA